MHNDEISKIAVQLVTVAFPTGKVENISALAGDASSRKYYRITLQGGESVVMMEAPDEKSVNLFMEMTEIVRWLWVDAPDIYSANGRFALLEDLGDTLLQDHVKDAPIEKLETEYKKVIDSLVIFQKRVHKMPNKTFACFNLRFDVEKLTFESDFTCEHFFKGYLKQKISADTLKTLQDEWGRINRILAEQMETLAHRDLHSRNIMVKGDRRVWIDYQDARMGRGQYDLASLIFDPYVDIPHDMALKLADYYYEETQKTKNAPWDHETFIDIFELSGLQRIYKALGTYGYQTEKCGTDVYRPYIEPAIKTVKRILEGRNDLPALRDTLFNIFTTTDTP